MDRNHYEEMLSSVNCLEREGKLSGKRIYLFGHCNATEELLELLLSKGYKPAAILDNNRNKQGDFCRGIPIIPPCGIEPGDSENTAVCIAARAYASMARQLRKLGYQGEIYKVVDYNSFADYSLSDGTVKKMQERLERGMMVKQELEKKYPGHFKILCPFAALGDIFYMMSYLPYFLEKRKIEKAVVCVVGEACAKVAALFGAYAAEVYPQKKMDELIQACLYQEDKDSYIAHQDRPYVVNLHKALHIRCIPLKKIYCCGVFGLLEDTKPVMPVQWKQYPDLKRIRKGRAVIISPYAKSVPALPQDLWKDIVVDYKENGYQCFTNISGGEEPLPGTEGISPQIAELKSVVEWAGTFIGLRSGLCDVIQYADCRKLAVYPDYHYCDTEWKAIDMYALDGWENIVAGEGFVWNRN